MIKGPVFVKKTGPLFFGIVYNSEGPYRCMRVHE